MNPYTPFHDNMKSSIVGDIPEKFLDSSKGTTLKYKFQEEWNDVFAMLWEINVKIEESGIIKFKNTDIEAISLTISGRSIEQNGFRKSSWHWKDVSFNETRIIDKRSKVMLKRERTWKNRTRFSPATDHQVLTLDKLKYSDGTVISWTNLAQDLQSGKRPKVAIDRKKKEDNKNPKSEKNTNNNIMSVLKSLSKLGFYKGKIDGVSSPELLVAALEWSKDNGFAFNGSFSPALVSILELKSSGENLGKK